MNLPGIVLFCILLGGSFVMVNSLGLSDAKLIQAGAPTAAQLAPDNENCPSTASGIHYQCEASASTNIVGAGFYSLGYFLGAFIDAIPLMIQGALVPGYIVSYYFGVQQAGALVALGMYFLIALFAWGFIANRQRLEPE